MTNSPRFYKCFAVLSFINLLGIGGLGLYNFKQHQQMNLNTEEFKAFRAQLDGIKEQQHIFEHHFQVIQQQLNQKTTHITILHQVLWLIRQAKWQLQIMHNTDTALQLLSTAQKIAFANHWMALDEAIQHDIYQLKDQNLIQDPQFIKKIQDLYMLVEELQRKTTPHQSLTFNQNEPLHFENPRLQEFIHHLKPFLSIERFHHRIPKILSPNEQYQVFSTMLMMLTEMQLTGLNRDVASYQSLVSALAAQWEILSSQIHEPKVTTAIQDLQQVHLNLEKPIFFSSFAEIHQLIDMAGKNL